MMALQGSLYSAKQKITLIHLLRTVASTRLGDSLFMTDANKRKNMSEGIVYQIAREAVEAGWCASINFDTGVVTFTSDDMHSHMLRVESIKLNDILQEVNKCCALFSVKATVAKYLSDIKDNAIQEDLTPEEVSKIYQHAEALEKKLLDLKGRLKALKLSASILA